MRGFVCVLAFVLVGCRAAPHIDLSLRTDGCRSFPGNPPPASDCASMALDCANFIELRAYESNDRGDLGSILGSNCLSTQDLGAPADLCALQAGHAPFSLLKDLPNGKTVRLRIRALWAAEPDVMCNDDLPGRAAPTVVFDGFSTPLQVDGEDHSVVIQLAVCASCATAGRRCLQGNLPPICLSHDDRCDDGTRATFVPDGCCGICTPI